MNRWKIALDERQLEADLRSQAAQGFPAFSEALHQRATERLRGLTGPSLDAARSTGRGRQHGAGPAQSMGGIGLRIRFRRIVPLAAAAVLVVTMGVGWNLRSGAVRTVSSITKPAALPATMPALPEIDVELRAAAPLAHELADARYAYMDRDARRLTQFVIRQLDVIPDGQ